MNDSVQARLYARLESGPDRRAIAFYNGVGEFSWYTWEQLYQRAAGYAARLADHGVGSGDVCILVLASTESSATLALATLLRGAVPLLVAPPAMQGDGAFSSLKQILDHVIHRTRPRLVICPESMADAHVDLDQGRRRTRFLFGVGDLRPDDSAHLLPVAPGAMDVAAMQLTSGTTGFPRICVWKQSSLLAALAGTEAAIKLNGEDVCLNWTPLYHDLGLVNSFLLSLYSGMPLVMLAPHDFIRKPALWLRALHETGATITWAPNFGFALATQRVGDADMDGVWLGGVRAFWNAAERIHVETMEAFHKRFAPFGLRFSALKTSFGCAENVGGATFSALDGAFIHERVDRNLLQEQGIARPVSESEDEGRAVAVVGVGRPHPDLRIEILSETGAHLPDGHVGEVALDTPSPMSGYLGDASATRRALHGTLLRTGDLGYLRDGELFWVGRVKERIHVRGKKLDPSDFESALAGVSGLRQGCFAAFGVDDAELGTQRIVIVAEVREPGARGEDLIDEIRDRTFLRLGVTVDDVVLVRKGTLTKTSSGKRRHHFFRQLYMDGGLKHLTVSGNGTPTPDRRSMEQPAPALGVAEAGQAPTLFPGTGEAR